MAEGLNRVTLIGNLGADPELKYTQNGQAVLRLRLATTESYVNRAGERQQRRAQREQPESAEHSKLRDHGLLGKAAATSSPVATLVGFQRMASACT